MRSFKVTYKESSWGDPQNAEVVARTVLSAVQFASTKLAKHGEVLTVEQRATNVRVVK